VEWEVRVDAAVCERHAGAARFDFGLVPWGYAWVFPKRSHLSVGMLSLARGTAQLEARLERYLESLGVSTAFGVERHGALIPVAPRAGPLARDRILLCGDAAGLVDPLTCEGISHAIQSGRLAAQALLEAELRPDGVPLLYEASLREAILPELRLARFLCTVLYRAPAWRGTLFRRLGQSLCEAMAEVVSGGRTYRELLGSPSNYGRLLLRLSRGGRVGAEQRA
jgi:flavin-dependent dehydrogenase